MRRPPEGPHRPADTRTDAQLLASVEHGDRAAFEVFYRRHAAWLAVPLSYRCADRPEPSGSPGCSG